MRTYTGIFDPGCQPSLVLTQIVVPFRCSGYSCPERHNYLKDRNFLHILEHSSGFCTGYIFWGFVTCTPACTAFLIWHHSEFCHISATLYFFCHIFCPVKTSILIKKYRIFYLIPVGFNTLTDEAVNEVVEDEKAETR